MTTTTRGRCHLNENRHFAGMTHVFQFVFVTVMYELCCFADVTADSYQLMAELHDTIRLKRSNCCWMDPVVTAPTSHTHKQRCVLCCHDYTCLLYAHRAASRFMFSSDLCVSCRSERRKSARYTCALTFPRARSSIDTHNISIHICTLCNNIL